ncbi:MAG: DUF4199 domain-containing protein [Cytophagales bacterium]|nr:DUF4199 domain-containing protein [Cytophagales bacterium]
MNKIIKTSLIFGTVFGIVGFVWFLGVYFAGHNAFYSFAQKLSLIMMGAATLWAVWMYRSSNEGNLTFGEGALTGISMNILAALITCSLIYIYTYYINPDMVQLHILTLKQYLAANKKALIDGSNETTYKGTLKAVNEVTSYTLALDAFIWKVVEGFMFSFLISVALRRKNIV